MRILYTLLFFSVYSFGLAQGETNMWYFGENAALNFNSGSPIALTDSEMYGGEGCAAISNSEGQLLFYSNGIDVWNRNHQIMPNGTDLNGSNSSTQSCIFVPKPNSDSIYYIFTTPALADPDGLNYSEVDLSLDGGFGAVTANKNILLRTPTCEKITTVKHANGIDFWVLSHDYGNTNYIAYLVTEAGVNTTPVISAVGTLIDDNVNETVGYLKFSPDGSKVLSCNYQDIVELLDFNTATGQVSNPVTVTTNSRNYGAEFSPSGTIAYITTGDVYTLELLQFNLQAANIPSTEILLHLTNFAINENQIMGLQMAPDGKIYASITNTNFLSRINNPDVLGVGCNFELNAVSLQTGIAAAGLPQFIQSYFTANFTFQNTCFGDTTIFSLTGSQTVTGVVWDFGDGATSTVFNPSHTYTLPGNYTVTAVITGGTETITRSRTITIAAIPVATSISTVSLCSVTNNYDLSQHTATILGTQSNTEFAVEYFTTLTNAENDLNKIVNPVSLTQGNTLFYAKVFNQLNRQCSAITSFAVEWFQQPTATQPTAYVICENMPYDFTETFDLSTVNPTVLNGQSNALFTVTYHFSPSDAELGLFPLPMNYTNVSPTQTLYIRVTNNNSFDCYATTSLQIQVIQQPAIQPVSDLLVCDDNSNDGVAAFDLNQKTNEILNGQSSSVFEVSYFLSSEDAVNASNPLTTSINNTTNPQTIYYSIVALGNAACQSIGSFFIRVSDLPAANIVSDFYLCDVANNGSELFLLQSKDSEVLGNQNQSDFQVSYHLSQLEAAQGTNPLAPTYANTSNPQIIYARIQNAANFECYDTTSFTIGLHSFPVAYSCDDLIVCDDESNDGAGQFDLDANYNQVLGSQSASDFSVRYYENLIDAQNGVNPLGTTYTNETNPQTIYVRIENVAESSCYDLTSFSLVVRQQPQINLEEKYIICEGVPITITAPIGFTSYSWSTGSTTPSTIITTAGLYTITVTEDYGDILCATTESIVVENSNVATLVAVQTIDFTDNENSLVVWVEGAGDYEYSIDGINYQDSNQFTGLSSGEYTVYINDKNECGYITAAVYLLMYPKFFTPNGDGHNDVWRIKLSETEPTLQTTIFDRYGKIITVFNGNQQGWDGTYNGQNLPSSDYWFVLKRPNGKEYKGHFSLKR